jgi:hypothetical protein
MSEDSTNTIEITDPFILQDIWFTGLAHHKVNEWLKEGKTIEEVINELEFQGSKKAAFLLDFFKGLPGEYEQRFKEAFNSLEKLYDLRFDISNCYKDLFKSSNYLYDDGIHKKVLCFIQKWELELADGRTYICNIENNGLVQAFVNKVVQALKIIIDDIDARIEYLKSENNNNIEPAGAILEENQEDELSTKIKSHLKPIENIFNNQEDFNAAVDAIKNFYSAKKIVSKPIFVKNRNIKILAYALGEIWRSQTNNIINFEYLDFYRKTFTIFDKQKIDESTVFSSNLYKYSISKT